MPLLLEIGEHQLVACMMCVVRSRAGAELIIMSTALPSTVPIM